MFNQDFGFIVRHMQHVHHCSTIHAAEGLGKRLLAKTGIEAEIFGFLYNGEVRYYKTIRKNQHRT